MRSLIICLCLCLASPLALADRLKDIASIAGVRSNQLIGYGLVVGLDGSGDQTSQTPFTVQTFENMLTQFGITVPDVERKVVITVPGNVWYHLGQFGFYTGGSSNVAYWAIELLKASTAWWMHQCCGPSH